MSGPIIGAYEAVTYGSYAAARIQSCAKLVDASYAPVLKRTVEHLAYATETMTSALKRAGEAEVDAAAREVDPAARAREVLERLASYAGSRADGKALTAALLDQQSLREVTRRKPPQLLVALDHALVTLGQNQDKLPEHASWSAEITAARDALSARLAQPAVARPRPASPEVASAHAEWLRVYDAAKLIVEGVLRMEGVAPAMSEIFPDVNA